LENGRKKSSASAARFGAFAGVFTPTVLTILGIILFLRIGWVVGQAGLAGALIIIVVANLISLITGLSLSSVATNMSVKAGGTYYMISRTLGLEIGGAIGIPLYLSQAISVAFYLIGFTEAFVSIFPQIDPRLLATGLALLFGALAYLGADFILKIQFGILAIIGLALLSFFTGPTGQAVSPPLFANQATTASFWMVFAIFFPAVTGIMVGVSMSGDLKEPGRAIPLGTLSAIGLTFIVYLAVAVWMGTHASPEDLIANNMIMQKLARWPLFILLGVWASTLSSALGSVMAAPRTLKALAKDRVLPRSLGAQMGSATEPRLAVLVTTVAALIIIWMGNLNFVAPIITMFFLNTYGMINLSAGLESLIGNPSYRPQFKVHWAISLLGAAGCYGAMFLINTPATLAAIFISYGIFVFLGRRALRQDWGDLRTGFWFSIARFGLIHLEASPPAGKNWRPNTIVFTGVPPDRPEVVEAGAWLGGGRGMVTFYHLIVGDLDKLCGRGLRETSRSHMQKYLREMGVIAFAECSLVDDFEEGVVNTMQTHGLAGIEPNTAILGWSTEPDVQKDRLGLVRRLVALNNSSLFLHLAEDQGFGRRRRIDVWWRGRDRNGELMLLLAYLIRNDPFWEGAEIRVLRLVKNQEAVEGAKADIAALLQEARVEAEPVILTAAQPEEPFISTLKEASRESDLVLLGMPYPKAGQEDELARRLNEMLACTTAALLVRSGEVEDILEAE